MHYLDYGTYAITLCDLIKEKEQMQYRFLCTRTPILDLVLIWVKI